MSTEQGSGRVYIDTKTDLIINETTEAILHELETLNELQPNQYYLTPDIETDNNVQSILNNLITSVNALNNHDHDSTYLKLSGGIINGIVTLSPTSGYNLINQGSAGTNAIMTRGIVGNSGTGSTIGDLYLNYNTGYNVYFTSGTTIVLADGSIKEQGTLLSNKYASLSHTHDYSAVYTGTSATKGSNTTLSNLRIGYTSGNLYIWNS